MGLCNGSRRPLRGRLRPQAPQEARGRVAGVGLPAHALRRRLSLRSGARRDRRRGGRLMALIGGRLRASAGNRFFNLFHEAGTNILRAAELLDRLLQTWPDSRDLGREILLCEQEGDRITHDLIQMLNRKVPTPVDRHDVYALASALDDVVDYTEEAANFLRLYNI